MRIGWALLGTVLVTGCASPPDDGSPVPSTDVWIVELAGASGALTLGTPANLTDREGYDNQPAFLPDGSGFLYSSGDGDQVDIWRYRFDTQTAENITNTPENEYSPQPIPDDDGFSVVRVGLDGDQRLWRFEVGGSNPSLLIEWEDEIEFSAWIDAELVALRVFGSPNELKLADPSIGWVERDPVARSVGRVFGKVPDNNAFTFIHKVSAEEWWVRQLDLLTRETFGIVRTLPGSEDFAWTPSGVLLMAQDAKIYRYVPAVDSDWVEVADFSAAGLSGIGRLAVDAAGARLLFVAARAASAGGSRVP